MKILLNAKSKKMGVELLANVSILIPSVQAFMFPLADTLCVSLDFNEKAAYNKDQTELIRTLQSLERLQ